MKHSNRRSARRAGPYLALAIALSTLVGACASGPSDFADLAAVEAGEPQPKVVKSAAEADASRDRLLRQARSRAGAADGADAVLPPAMALALIRQQQEDEARRLLLETNPDLAAQMPAEPLPEEAAPPAR